MTSWKTAARASVLAIGVVACGRDPRADAHAHRPSGAAPRVHAPARPAESAQHFVQRFYDWYLPRALDEHSDGGAESLVIRDTTFAFDPALLAALKADGEAQAASPGEIDGLDFDPFLASQDPCERYEAGAAVRHGAGYRVGVHAICQGKRSAKADPVAEVVPHGDTWMFVNFRYTTPSPPTDLVATLKLLAKERAEPAPPGSEGSRDPVTRPAGGG